MPVRARAATLPGMDGISLRRRAAALLAVAACAAIWSAASPADARGGGERTEVRVSGLCGRASTDRLRLRGDGSEIRVDTEIRTRRTGVWRVTVLHERRIVARARVRATREAGGFQHRVFVPDFAGADAVRVRAVAPGGETCSASAVLPDAAAGRTTDVRL